MDLLRRITHYPAVMGGRPCILGMRVTVGTIVGLLAAGSYAAWRTEEVELPLP